MSPAKNQESSSLVPAWLRGLAAWLLGGGRPMLILLVLVGLFGGGMYLAWMKHKARILDSPDYRVALEQVEITPLPDWIHSDLRAEVFRDPRLDGPLSIMDDDLVDRIKDAFAQHPWVARVTGVAKQHPASVQVEIVYRRPVCMIEMPGKAWAVDGEGVVLPSEDFSPVEATRYPHVVGVDREPTVPPGRRWGDARVVGGAEIAAALGPAWDELKLQRIMPLSADPTTAANNATANNAGGDSSRRSIEPFFALFTRGGTRILWGYAPGANVLGELPAAEKLARLKQYLTERDSLDGQQGQPQELDVRTLGKGANH